MNRRFEIRHISFWPAMRIIFVIFLVVGILFAILYAVMLAGMGFIATGIGDSAFGDDFGILRNLGFVMIPVIAIIYAVFGTIAAAVWICIYNIAASAVGGIEVELRPVEGVIPPAPQSGRDTGTTRAAADDTEQP
jgi:hypothetical protein